MCMCNYAYTYMICTLACPCLYTSGSSSKKLWEIHLRRIGIYFDGVASNIKKFHFTHGDGLD